MPKPLCEVCGDRHEPHQAHVFRVVKQPVVVKRKVVKQSVEGKPKKRSSDRHRKTPERLEYIRVKMREYQRRRRAKGL
jgi:hypothetical protein